MTTITPCFIITGASSGIGEKLAKIYSERNINIVLAARSTDKLNKLALELKSINKFSNKYLVVSYDASKESDCKNLIEIVIKQFGRIDLLLLCAGVSYHNSFKDTTDLNVYRQMMDINYFGYMYTTYYALPYMIKQQQKQSTNNNNNSNNKPQIAVISSISGALGLPLRAGYCASKFAVNGFFQALRLEVQSYVDITLLLPTTVNTPMRSHSLGDPNEKKLIHFHGEDDSKKMTIDQCCEIVIAAIDGRKKKVAFPFSNFLASVLHPIFPNYIDKILLKKAGGTNLINSNSNSNNNNNNTLKSKL
ncbi:short-chain dehydrogenase/reductase family protein [Dictyostelium discoideum AX4]|uniref:Short-chain dehydrogenase/reductase family protein n=1 Tax=Dictyostelium discoideum TaxID=44689 RepID=Q54SG1_DICDI|nr:short-chain dehydrogenase/reductase family protein [Dictyostelium discoideum AX4]EAL66242.2 short-chain dehydrogenase/reductase family protein [Dictyostelium discoideum AX4]|eukprot:XP_640078.2 short-chain dehydrogenase/reductase family protein [Dictyostelium discoideum AX4]